MMNKVLLEGRPIQDPLYETEKGMIKKVTFILACNGYSSKNADFIKCIAWNTEAERIHQVVVKGMLISVEGQIRTYREPDQDSGNYNYSMFVKVDSVNYLESKYARLKRIAS